MFYLVWYHFTESVDFLYIFWSLSNYFNQMFLLAFLGEFYRLSFPRGQFFHQCTRCSELIPFHNPLPCPVRSHFPPPLVFVRVYISLTSDDNSYRHQHKMTIYSLVYSVLTALWTQTWTNASGFQGTWTCVTWIVSVRHLDTEWIYLIALRIIILIGS